MPSRQPASKTIKMYKNGMFNTILQHNTDANNFKDQKGKYFDL